MRKAEESENCSGTPTADRPECFGDPDLVCPQDEDGIMQPRQACVPCPHLRPCLQVALQRRGKIRLVENPPAAKVTGFLKRWSDQKLSRSGKDKG